MRVAFLASDKTREQLLADAFLQGLARHGHSVATYTLGEEADAAFGTYDVACMVGVKSRELFAKHRAAGVAVIYLDKGYSRHKKPDGQRGWEYWRVSINTHHPTARLAGQASPSDRFDALGLEVAPWRTSWGAAPIILAGSSAKYHAFYGMKDPTQWVKDLVRDLRQITQRPLTYRPKPSWREAVPVRKTRFSELPETIDDVLAGAHLLITHGSNACYEAVMAGVPCIILGEAVARPISSTSLALVEAPQLVDDTTRRQWLANLGYWQWTAAEFCSGQAWEFLGQELHR